MRVKPVIAKRGEGKKREKGFTSEGALFTPAMSGYDRSERRNGGV